MDKVWLTRCRPGLLVLAASILLTNGCTIGFCGPQRPSCNPDGAAGFMGIPDNTTGRYGGYGEYSAFLMVIAICGVIYLAVSFVALIIGTVYFFDYVIGPPYDDLGDYIDGEEN